MTRLTPLLVLALITAACSGAAEPTATSSAPLTTTTAPPVATTASPATTTLPQATTTTVTAPAEILAFDTVVDTPPRAFDSFASTLTMEITLDDLAIELTGEGVWTTDAFECTVTTGLGGLQLTQRIVSSPETLWLDTGSGYEESSLFGTAAQSVISSCPSSPLFWAEFTSAGLGQVVGDPVTVDGRTAIKADLVEVLETFGGFDFVSGLEDATINEMSMWVDVETNVVLRVVADLELDGAFMAELGVPTPDSSGTVAMLMEIQVVRVNDPELIIDLPAAG